MESTSNVCARWYTDKHTQTWVRTITTLCFRPNMISKQICQSEWKHQKLFTFQYYFSIRKETADERDLVKALLTFLKSWTSTTSWLPFPILKTSTWPLGSISIRLSVSTPSTTALYWKSYTCKHINIHTLIHCCPSVHLPVRKKKKNKFLISCKTPFINHFRHFEPFKQAWCSDVFKAVLWTELTSILMKTAWCRVEHWKHKITAPWWYFNQDPSSASARVHWWNTFRWIQGSVVRKCCVFKLLLKWY